MSKPTRGATRPAASKKKAKKRPDIIRPAVQAEPEEVDVASEEETGAVAVATAPVLQFRPRSRDAAPARPAGRPATARSATFPTTDYSYVYTDLRIIALLVGSLLVALIALSFVIH
ncbi:MAG TPA: hypothetical protein VF960_09685 [Chloroflexota bacterium]